MNTQDDLRKEEQFFDNHIISLSLFSYSQINGEKVTNIQSLISNASRKLEMFNKELKFYSKLIDSQLYLLESIGISDENIDLMLTKSSSKIEKKAIYEFYSTETTEQFLTSFLETKEFFIYFKNHPYVHAIFLDPHFLMDVNTLFKLSLEWNATRRKKLFSALFEDLNSLTHYIETLYQFLQSISTQDFINNINDIISKIFKWKRAVLFYIDLEQNLIISEKENINIKYQLSPGKIRDAIKNEKKLLVHADDTGLTTNELTLIGKASMILLIPIQFSNRVLILYEKFGNFYPQDDLILTDFSRFISALLRILNLTHFREKRLIRCKSITDIFVKTFIFK